MSILKTNTRMIADLSVLTTLSALQAASVSGLSSSYTAQMLGRLAAGDKAGGMFRRVTGDQSALVVASTKTVSAVDIGADTLTSTAHGLVSGQGVIATAADAGLSLNTVYYVARIDANTISLHTTIVTALAGTSKVNITALAGSLSLKVLYDPKQAIYVIATGDDLDGSDGVWVRDFQGEVHATWWGLTIDGATNDAEPLNGFLKYMAMVGGEGFICKGQHYVTSKLSIDESLVTSDYEITRVNIRGEGMGNTQIICAHAGNGIEYLGGASGGLGAYTKWSNLRLRGSGQSGGVAIRADNAAWWHLENVALTEFDKHFNFTDVLSTVIDACVIRFGYEAGDFAYSDASRPNAIAFRDTITGAHYERGWLVTGASSFTYRGGTMEGNGNIEGVVFTGGYGIKAVDCGVEGMSGINVEGVYFEYQADKADIWITHATGNVMHKISGCGFARIDSTVRVTNNILFERAAGSSELWLGGNGFGALGTYTESTARPYIAAPSGSIIDAGNYWNSDTAKPDPIIFKSSATEDVEYRYQRLEDDFLGDAIDAKWNTRLGSDPQAAVAHGGSLLRGLVILTSGDDAAASMAVNGAQLDQGATQWQVNQGGFDMYVRAYLENITNVCVFIGMTDQVAALEMPFTMSGTTLTSNATNGFGVLFDTDATTDNWKLVGVKADVDATTQDAGVAPVANTIESWRMASDAAGNVTFFRNGAIIGTVLSNATTASTLLTPVFAIFSRTNASRVLVADYVRLRALK